MIFLKVILAIIIVGFIVLQSYHTISTILYTRKINKEFKNALGEENK